MKSKANMLYLCLSLSYLLCLPIHVFAVESTDSSSKQNIDTLTKLEQKDLMKRFEQVGSIIEEKCMACHTRDFDLPFYSSIPGIKDIIEKEFIDGIRAMDLRIELLDMEDHKKVNETVLAKMEWVVLNNTMPPAKFSAVHWGMRLSRDEEDIILAWVKENRQKYYFVEGMDPKYSNEPVQIVPLMKFDKEQALLGEKLFNDKRLSADDTISCASCHDLTKGGADALQFSKGINEQVGNVNSPTVFNSAYNIRQFWDGRVKDLKEQAGGPPLNPVEMGSKNWQDIILKLEQDTEFTQEFKKIYKDGWTSDNIQHSIAEYEKTLITPNSPFDRWLMGDDEAINQEAKEGYARFKAYSCASCHVGKILGGQTFEYMDLKEDYFADRENSYESDKGLYAFTKNEEDLHKFKVPTLRNIELTAPYLHDGTIYSLDEIVRIMGIYLVGIEVAPLDRIKIVTFLRTLTGELNGEEIQGKRVIN